MRDHDYDPEFDPFYSFIRADYSVRTFPTLPSAHFVKLYSDLNITHKNDLYKAKPFANNESYLNLLKYRNEEEKGEELVKHANGHLAASCYNSAKNKLFHIEEELKEVIDLLETAEEKANELTPSLIPEFGDSENGFAAKLEICRNLYYTLIFNTVRVAKTASEYADAIGMLQKIKGCRDADVLLQKYTEGAYEKACELMEKAERTAEYTIAASVFGKLNGYKDSDMLKEKCLNEAKRVFEAAVSFPPIAINEDMTVKLRNDGKIGVGRFESTEFDISEWDNVKSIAADDFHIIGLKADGTVAATGCNIDGECNVNHWRDVVSVYVQNFTTVGITKDGKVFTEGCLKNKFPASEQWDNIIAVSFTNKCMVGLKKDGTVVSTSPELDTSRCKNVVSIIAFSDYSLLMLKSDKTVEMISDAKTKETAFNTENWTDIESIYHSYGYIIGLRTDRTLAISAANYPYRTLGVEDWTDVKAVVLQERAGVYGLKTDGTILLTGIAADEKKEALSWSGIKEIFASDDYLIGLKYDGTVVSAGLSFEYGEPCDVSEWHDIVSVCVNDKQTAALTADGKVVSTGCVLNFFSWENIASIGIYKSSVVALKRSGEIYSSPDSNILDRENIAAFSAHNNQIITLKKDGTATRTYYGSSFDCNDKDDIDEEIKGENIIAVEAGGDEYAAALKYDGTVIVQGYYNEIDVSLWHDIVAVSAAFSHVVGLKLDGTVVAAGDNTYCQCHVDHWRDIVYICAGDRFTAGVKSDGTVEIEGFPHFPMEVVQKWSDIVALVTDKKQLAGIKSDGTVVTASEDPDYSYPTKLTVPEAALRYLRKK